MVVLGVVLEQVEAVAKPLLVPVLKKPSPGAPKPPPGQFSSCVKFYTIYFWSGSLIKGRDYVGGVDRGNPQGKDFGGLLGVFDKSLGKSFPCENPKKNV